MFFLLIWQFDSQSPSLLSGSTATVQCHLLAGDGRGVKVIPHEPAYSRSFFGNLDHCSDMQGVAFSAPSPLTTTSTSRRSFCVRPRNALRVTLGRYRGRIPLCSAAGGSTPSSAAVELLPSKDEDDDEVHTLTDPVVSSGGGMLSRIRRTFSPQPVDKKIAAIALPALGALSIDPAVALADMACIGYLGAVSLASVAVANNVFNISFTCFNFLGMATTPAIARSFGRGDDDEASLLIAQALWVAVVIGVSAMGVLSVYAQPLVRFFGASAAIAPQAVTYLHARIVSAPFLLASMVCNGAFRGFQDTRSVFLVSTAANLVNLALFPTLIFGAGLGVLGAGIATACGQIVYGVAMIAMLLRSRRLRLADLRRLPNPLAVISLLRTGAVLSVRTLSIYSTISFATATAARLGTVEVAAFEIGRQIYALFARLLDAVSVAAQALVALTLGQGDMERARDTANRILQMGVALGCGFFALLMLVLKKSPRLFTPDPAVAAMVTASFPYMAWIQPVNGLVFVFDGIYTAGRKFTALSVAIFIAAVCSSSVLLGVRRMSLSLPAVWMGLNVMMIFRALFLGIGYMSRYSPVLRKKFYRQEQAGSSPA